ncbi:MULTISPECIES: hypothetical protein [unclassified Haloferax]|jgi:hypothetical protein|uniref:hypothetical protein n=1 Tax=unclassified Haloferax TaxID=2625095 RepID=UPI0028754C18|nr:MULTISPECIES: hypothetical protein [unclassified Haloferax]MDS0243154.1 hypothetical protein [Haloferax sp. S2CR25]MDS0446275.1 hypothetical protein [Haloferax sp. S2CR25-2]
MKTESKTDIVNMVIGAALVIGSAILIVINGMLVTPLLFLLGGVYLILREIKKLKRNS